MRIEFNWKIFGIRWRLEIFPSKFRLDCGKLINRFFKSHKHWIDILKLRGFILCAVIKTLVNLCLDGCFYWFYWIRLKKSFFLMQLECRMLMTIESIEILYFVTLILFYVSKLNLPGLSFSLDVVVHVDMWVESRVVCKSNNLCQFALCKISNSLHFP